MTLAVQGALLPAASPTVNVTLLVPTLAQVKVLLVAPSIKRLVTPQLRVEPRSMSTALTVIVPLVLRLTVISLHTAIGAITSRTMTLAVQRALLPAASATV